MESVAALLARTTASVRGAPGDASARMKLFRLFCLTGQWERAATQLDTASGIDAQLAMTSLVYKRALHCEQLRAQVFEGLKTPLVLGEPQAWLGWLFEALRLDADAAGRSAKAQMQAEAGRAASPGAALREKAFADAPTRAGTLDDVPFDWIADADARLGPVCEAFIDGKYYWLPFERISSISITAPDDLIDLVWASAELVFVTGGTKQALLPSRYPGTETIDDDGLRCARRTEWRGSDEAGWRGVGQRELVTDRGETGLLAARRVLLGA